MLGRLLLVDQKDVRPWTVCNASGCRRFRNQGNLGSLSGEGEAREVDAAGKAV